MSDYFENYEEQLRCEEQLTTKLFRRIAKLEAELERIQSLTVQDGGCPPPGTRISKMNADGKWEEVQG